MKKLSELINQVAEIEGMQPEILLKRRTIRAVLCRHIISFVAVKIYGYRPNIVSSALGYISVGSTVQKSCYFIEKEIIERKPSTLHILTELLCKEEKTTKEKTDGICSLSDLYSMLFKSLPSELQNTLRTHGNMSKMAMTDTKQPYSDTLSSTRAEKSVTKKADSPTLPTQHGTRSFLFNSDIAWAIRETARNTNLTTKEERAMYYNALLAACEWGRKCDYENRNRKSELKDQNIYSSIID